VTGWILRIVSLIVLAAVAGVSTSPTLCWLPCAVEDQRHGQPAAVASHCAHEAAAASTRLTGFDGGCDDCDQLRLADADRLSSRQSLLGGINPVAGMTVNLQADSSSILVRGRADTPPDRRASAPVPLPLRI
jgi:hypothetical protein